VSLILFCAAASFAQNLGEIARQERERKKEQPPRAAYVYTNDDLQRQHILVPDDRARALAARGSTSDPAVQAAQTPAPAVPLVVAVSPAPIATPSASVSAPIDAAPVAPISRPPVSANAGTVQSKPSPLEAILRAVREASVQKRPAAPAHRLPQPVIAYIPFGVRPSPATQTKPVRNEIATVPVSRMVSSRPQRHLTSPEPVDSGMAGIVAVERGDSLWKLAKRYLGSGTRWRELASLNSQILNANVLHVGEWICLPSGDLQIARQKITPRACAPATIAQASAQITEPSTAFAMQIASHRRLTQP
jgi:nucleoid-associated protein YgaU